MNASHTKQIIWTVIFVTGVAIVVANVSINRQVILVAIGIVLMLIAERRL